MLYVSRYVHPKGYGVVDTDDDVEEIVPRDDLYLACCTLGMRIEGVFTEEDDTGFRYISYAGVFQPKETQTQLQLKTKLLKHVDVLTYKSMITHFRWQCDEISEPVTIRLSDFGTVLADYSLTSVAPANRHVVTFVFDDKISLGGNNFCLCTDSSLSIGVNGIGVKLDLHEVTNDLLARQIYIASFGYKADEARESIIDNPDRQESILSCWGDGMCFI